MTQQEINDGNKLIAEFMGAKWKYQAEVYKEFGWFYEMNNRPTKWASCWHGNEHLLYHSSWEWLMPVVEKIKNISRDKDLEINERFQHKEAKSRYAPIANELANVNIENVHYCVVRFIQWYNSLSK